MERGAGKRKTKRIHVNQHNIRHNRKILTKKDSGNQAGEQGPRHVLSVKTYNSNEYGNEVIIYGQDGKEAARVLYHPDNPLSCGATVWIESKGDVEVVG